MRISLIVSILFIFGVMSGYGHTLSGDPESKKYEPDSTPDRVVLSWVGDPSVSQAVTWRTDTTVTYAAAQIDIADANGYELKGEIIRAHTVVFNSNIGKAHYHSVNFTGLASGQLYAYRVGDGVNWSSWYHFRTAFKEPEPFSFVYFGDAQDDIRSLWSRVVSEAFRTAPRAAFTLHGGDLVNRGNLDEQWGEWFEASGITNTSIPVIATAGNHEYYRVKTGNLTNSYLTEHWRTQFSFPENGPKDLEETCYYIDYQGARIVSLNSYHKYEEQAAWLREVLKNNTQRWTIVVFHYPMLSPRGRNYPVLFNLWKPVLDEFKVDLVLTGHDHTYARSNELLHTNAPQGAKNTENSGTVYVVSTSGPKLREMKRDSWMARAGNHIQLFQVIHVDPMQITFEARLATGEVYDSFIIKKQEGQINMIVELLPEEKLVESSELN